MDVATRKLRLKRPFRILSSKRHAWGWWFSADEETYSGPHKTRDDAVHAGFNEECGEDCKISGMGCFHVMEARQGPIRLARYFDVDTVMERVMECIDDDHGGEDGIDWDRYVTDAQHAQLGRWLQRLISFWQWWNGVEVRTYLFTHSRNGEHYTWHRRYPPAG